MRIFLDVHEVLFGFKAAALFRRCDARWFKDLELNHDTVKKYGVTLTIEHYMRRMVMPESIEKAGEWNHPCLQEVFDEPYFWDDFQDLKFWEQLPRMPWATDLVNLVKDRETYIVTSPPKYAPIGISGTYSLIARHFPAFERRCISCPTELKHLLCKGPEDLMIDDSPTVIDNWRGFGGTAYQMPSLFCGYEGKTWDNHHVLHILGDIERLIKQCSQKQS